MFWNGYCVLLCSGMTINCQRLQELPLASLYLQFPVRTVVMQHHRKRIIFSSQSGLNTWKSFTTGKAQEKLTTLIKYSGYLWEQI